MYGETCNDCSWCTYSNIYGCFICDLDGDPVELDDEACDMFDDYDYY